MRKFIIDTDTASDDAVGIILALREPSVHVELITVVAGNVPIDMAVKNALHSIEVSNTYAPPVYKGMGVPLIRDLITGESVHGEDGMGNMFMPEPTLKKQEGHAIDAMIDCVKKNPGIEIIALGPLTNVAMAMLKEPEIMKTVGKITIMGGAKVGSSSWDPVAEYNIYADAEAAHVVLKFGVPLMIVQLDVCLHECSFDEKDMDRFNAGSDISKFCMRCNEALRKYYIKVFDRNVITLPDPTAVVAAICPDCISEQFEAYTFVEIKGERTYGQLVVDPHLIAKQPANAVICESLDATKFKDYLFKITN